MLLEKQRSVCGNTNGDGFALKQHFERYSRHFNIRILGVSEEDGEDCMAIILDYITPLGFKHAEAEVENTHHTGKKQGERPRRIIAKLYSRPLKRKLLQSCISHLATSKFGKKLFHLCERLLWKGREFVSQKENFLWTEGQSRSCRNL